MLKGVAVERLRIECRGKNQQTDNDYAAEQFPGDNVGASAAYVFERTLWSTNLLHGKVDFKVPFLIGPGVETFASSTLIFSIDQ